MIHLQKINVHFGKGTAAFRVAINNLDLRIQEGEFFNCNWQ